MDGIELISRGIVERDGRILLCKSVRNGYFFLPGGHIEFGESGEKALLREMDEETGLKILDLRFVGIFEQGFMQNGENHHEISLIYSAKLKGEIEVVSKEDQISFEWLEIQSLPESDFIPKIFAEAILNWHKDKRNIYLTKFEN